MLYGPFAEILPNYQTYVDLEDEETKADFCFPIEDFSYRAVEVLNSVDIIACEDTRNSLKLLSHYDIHKKLIAYHKFNERNSADGIIELLKSGKNVAVISDSGMPVISDPGNILIQKLKQNNLRR